MRKWIDPAVPGLKAETPAFDITLNERLAFAGAFALVILAALGAESIAQRNDTRAAAIALTIVLIVLTFGTIWISRTFTLAPGPIDWGDYKIFSELAFLGAAALLFVFRIPIPTLVLLLLAQRVISEGGVHHSFAEDAAYPQMKIFEPLRNVHEPFRVTGAGWAMIPGTNALYGLEDVRGYEALTFAPYAQTYPLWCVPQSVFFNRVDDLGKPFLSFLNVRFAFGDAWTPIPPGWRVAARERNAVLLENPNALERAFVPGTVRLGPNASIETDFEANGPGRVSIRRAPRGYALDADMQADGWIIVSICDWKGWRADIDGRRVKTQRANIAFIGIHVPQGKHAIRLVYWPDSFVRGRAVSFATVLVIGVFAVLRRRVSQSHSRIVS